jgi:hypothetical protein
VTEQNLDQPTTASLFGVLWNALTDLMGSSATATLMRRAAKHAAAKRPGLSVLVIHRPMFEYEYIVPARWNEDRVALEDLGELVHTLVPLLTELTGLIAVRRLRSIPDLVSAGLLEADHDEEVS